MAQKDVLEWCEKFRFEGKRSTLYLYENVITHEFDFVQINDLGESITTRVPFDAVDQVMNSIRKGQK